LHTNREQEKGGASPLLNQFGHNRSDPSLNSTQARFKSIFRANLEKDSEKEVEQQNITSIEDDQPGKNLYPSSFALNYQQA